MKKILAVMLAMVLLVPCFGTVAQAKVGDKIGTALHTDIVVYINNFAIPSYAVNGQSVIVAEDLRNFGFNVDWNQWDRSLTIYRNGSSEVSPMYVGKGYTTGATFTSILETDISVWAGGRRLTSYAMNGYTMIPVEELTMFGQVQWVQNERALKMWIEDGLQMNTDKQIVSYRYYPGTSAPDYGWITEDVCWLWKDEYQNIQRMYVSNSANLQEYVDYIKRNGWVLDENIQDSEGNWYAAYINHSLRIGIAVAEIGSDGIVVVQVRTDLDDWIPGFDD